MGVSERRSIIAVGSRLGMRLLVIGATGALGREVVSQALDRGQRTAALVRKPAEAALPDSVELVEGDVRNPASLQAAVGGRDAVICALGTPSPRRPSTLLKDGTANLVNAMSRDGVRQLVCVTVLGTGSSAANGSFVYRHVILRVLAPMMPDKQAQEDVIRASELDWTIVRPPRFVGGSPRGGVRMIREGGNGRVGRVARPDLARFLLDCASEPRYVREAVVVGS
jgi:uncharacterized protein YbjT (DUF2867 family)